MHIAIVNIYVKSEFVESFREACINNARHSLEESGVVQFDVLQQQDNLNHFILYEVYKTPNDQLSHRETEHYQTWRDLVATWMTAPREGVVFENVFPPDDLW